MKALVLKEPGILHIENVSLRKPGSGEVLVKVKAASVCSTDFHRIFKGKSYFYPIVLGHEFSGIIYKTAKNVKKVKAGDRVVVAPLIPCRKCYSCVVGHYSLCDDYDYIGSRTNGGYAEYVIVPEENVLAIPEVLSYRAAAFSEPLAVAIHGLIKVIKPGDKVLIMGAGAIGFLCAGAAGFFGAIRVVVADIDRKRLFLGEELGFETIFLESGGDPVLDDLKGDNFDVVVEATGSTPGLINSIKMLKKNGRLLILSLYENTAAFDKKILEKITRQEIEIKGSWNSYSQPFPGKEWDTAIHILKKKIFDPRRLISHEIKLHEADRLLEEIYLKDRENLVKVMITMD